MKAKLYIQGEICTGNLLYSDNKTYIIELHVFEILDGKFKGEKIEVLAGSDKFMEWILDHDMTVNHPNNCQCVRCKPLERPCNCPHCLAYKKKDSD